MVHRRVVYQSVKGSYERRSQSVKELLERVGLTGSEEVKQDFEPDYPIDHIEDIVDDLRNAGHDPGAIDLALGRGRFADGPALKIAADCRGFLKVPRVESTGLSRDL